MLAATAGLKVADPYLEKGREEGKRGNDILDIGQITLNLCA